MPLSNPRFAVSVRTDDGPVEHTVEVTNGDRLRAELEANRAGLPPLREAPLNHTAVWLWCALVRLGLYNGKCAAFRADDLLDMEPLEEEAPVDPTSPGTPPGSP